MKIYYIQHPYTPSHSGSIARPAVLLDYNAQNEIIKIRSVPLDEYNKSLFTMTSEEDTEVTTISGQLLEVKGICPTIPVRMDNLNLKGRHDRQFWSVCCDTRIHYWLRGPIPYYQAATKSHVATEWSPLFYEKLEVFSFVSPFLDSSFSDCFGIVIASDLALSGDPVELITDHGFTTATEIREHFLPHIVLSVQGELSSMDHATVTATVVDAAGNPYGDMEIWFENVNGQISHNRRQTTNGTTFTRVSASGMDVGDTVRIKAGTKFVTGLADITLTVVSD